MLVLLSKKDRHMWNGQLTVNITERGVCLSCKESKPDGFEERSLVIAFDNSC